MTGILHEIPPVWNRESTILILGSFPSVKSREGAFFYHHPRNRFWKVLAEVLERPLPETVEEKKKMLLAEHVALWDVVGACTIRGSSDSSIRDVTPNPVWELLEKAPIGKIYANGSTAYRLYQRYTQERTGMPAVKLPSTSPANAAWSTEQLVREWSVIRQDLRKKTMHPVP